VEKNTNQVKMKFDLIKKNLVLGKRGVLLGIIFTLLYSIFILLRLILPMYTPKIVTWWFSISSSILLIIPFIMCFISYNSIRKFLTLEHQKKTLTIFILLIIFGFSFIADIVLNIMYICAFQNNYILYGPNITDYTLVLGIFILNIILLSAIFILLGFVLYKNKTRFNNYTRLLFSSFVMLPVVLADLSIFIVALCDIRPTFYFHLSYLLFTIIVIAVLVELFIMVRKLTPEMFEPNKKIT